MGNSTKRFTTEAQLDRLVSKMSKDERAKFRDAATPGLWVRVIPSGERTFYLTYRRPGHTSTTDKALERDGVKVTTLKEARAAVIEFKAALGKGEDPEERTDRVFHQEILSTTFSETQKYTNVILVAGYAGFFTIWSSMKDKLPAAPMFAAAALITISVGVFVAFEIYKMVSNHQAFFGISRLLEQLKGNVAEALTTYERQGAQSQIRLFGVWRYVLIVTCGTGLAAWAIIVVYFIMGAFGLVKAACL